MRNGALPGDKGAFSAIHCPHKEVRPIKTSAPIHLVVHEPQTPEGRHELAVRVAHAHADLVCHHLEGLSCPAEQKLALLDAVIASVKAQEKTPPGGAAP